LRPQRIAPLPQGVGLCSAIPRTARLAAGHLKNGVPKMKKLLLALALTCASVTYATAEFSYEMAPGVIVTVNDAFWDTPGDERPSHEGKITHEDHCSTIGAIKSGDLARDPHAYDYMCDVTEVRVFFAKGMPFPADITCKAYDRHSRFLGAASESDHIDGTDNLFHKKPFVLGFAMMSLNHVHYDDVGKVVCAFK
jgi:hypothetical protein